MIFRSFESRNAYFLISLFNMYVRPQLEYASTVWSPHLKMDIANLSEFNPCILSGSQRYVICLMSSVWLKLELGLLNNVDYILIRCIYTNFALLIRCKIRQC